MPGMATVEVSYLGDICGTRGDIRDAAHVDVLFITLRSTDSFKKVQHMRMNQIFAAIKMHQSEPFSVITDVADFSW